MPATTRLLALLFLLPHLAMAVDAVLPAPALDLRAVPAKPPLLATWAHAGGRATLHVEAPREILLVCDQYQVDGKSAIPLARNVPLPALRTGPNDLEIPLPTGTERGKILCKIARVQSDGTAPNLLANLMVDVLPKDAWDSLAKRAKAGAVFIDPKYKGFKSWAGQHGITSSPAIPGTPSDVFFGNPPATPVDLPPGRIIVFERDAPDALPTVEVRTTDGLTKIILPPGFLDALPHSATAQAALLQWLLPSR